MTKPIIAEYKYNDNNIEIDLKLKKDNRKMFKYVYTYDKNNLIDNCKVYVYKSDGSYDCNNIKLDRYDNITKVFMNNVLVDEIIKNDNEYEIKSYVYKENGKDSNTTSIMFFNDHIDKYLYINGDKKCGLESSWINYFDKNNRLIKTISSKLNKETLKISYEYDDKNRIIKKLNKSYKKENDYENIMFESLKYDEDNNKCIGYLNFELGDGVYEDETSGEFTIYNPIMIEHIGFNTLESQQLLSEYGKSFLIYTNYLLLNPYNRDIGINFKYDNQSRVTSKEILYSDILSLIDFKIFNYIQERKNLLSEKGFILIKTEYLNNGDEKILIYDNEGIKIEERYVKYNENKDIELITIKTEKEFQYKFYYTDNSISIYSSTKLLTISTKTNDVITIKEKYKDYYETTIVKDEDKTVKIQLDSIVRIFIYNDNNLIKSESHYDKDTNELLFHVDYEFNEYDKKVKVNVKEYDDNGAEHLTDYTLDFNKFEETNIYFFTDYKSIELYKKYGSALLINTDFLRIHGNIYKGYDTEYDNKGRIISKRIPKLFNF